MIATGVTASIASAMIAMVAGDAFWGWMAASLSIGALTTALVLAPEPPATLRAVADALGDPERFRNLADALLIPVVLTETDCRGIIFANEVARQRFGLDPRGSGRYDDIDSLFADDEFRRQLADTIMRNGALERFEMKLTAPDGSPFWALVAARQVSFDGRPAILSGFYDISDRKAAEEALLASEVRYALISRASQDGIWDWDLPSGQVYYSARWRELAGADPGSRLNRIDDWFARVHADDLPPLKRAIDGQLAGRTSILDIEYRLRHGDGDYRWMHCRGILLRGHDGMPLRMAGSQSDISLRKTYELHLHNAAYEDRLTGLGNRAAFNELAGSHATPERFGDSAVVLLNIDGFRRINDSLGQANGDRLLVELARRLRACTRPGDTLARIESDEFAVWLKGFTDGAACLAFVQSLVETLSAPYDLDQAQATVTISAGIAVCGVGAASTGNDLLHHARLALDQAKTQRSGWVVLFDDALVSETKLVARLSRDLQTALASHQICFEYQPVMALGRDGSSRIAGFESLMRWDHPELKRIPPARFIPLAEETGIIGALGLYAIEEAAARIAAWTSAALPPPPVTIAVNLSTRQLASPQAVKTLLDTLDRLDLPPHRLKLEITESVMMSDPDAMVGVCQALRARGIDLALDDFGTGYSSLAYLHRFPVSQIKIDRSFVNRMISSPEALRLVRSIIELAHDLGLEVVAEGVESEDEVRCLAELGCDFAQGYFFARPLSIGQATGMLFGQTGGGSAG